MFLCPEELVLVLLARSVGKLLTEYILAGQLIVASLLSRKIKSRLLIRDPEKAESLFGKQDESVLQVHWSFTIPFFSRCFLQKKKVQ